MCLSLGVFVCVWACVGRTRRAKLSWIWCMKRLAVCVWHVLKGILPIALLELTPHCFFLFLSFLSFSLSFLLCFSLSVLLSLQSMVDMGNRRAKQLYEAHLPEGFRRPQTDQYPPPACFLCVGLRPSFYWPQHSFNPNFLYIKTHFVTSHVTIHWCKNSPSLGACIQTAVLTLHVH